MDLLQHVLTNEPDAKLRVGETLYCWGETLAVIVRENGEIGQFASSLPVARAEVKSAMNAYVNSRSD